MTHPMVDVAFGTGGDLAGEIFVYEIPAASAFPNMTEEQAGMLARAAHGEDYAPEIRDYAPRPGSQCRVQPIDQPVYTPEGDLIPRDDNGEPLEEW